MLNIEKYNQSKNFMEPVVETKECYCRNKQVIKRGFSGSAAITGFIGTAVICAVLIAIIQPPNIDTWVSIAAILTGLGFFAGTIGMNKLFAVCPECGSQTPLN